MSESNHKHSFLVVDDEPNVLDSIYDLFRREYDVHRAGSAKDAKKLLERQAVHIVLSDQRMPEVTGVELFREIKDVYPDTIRIIITGYADLQAVIQAINEGQVFRYVTKPWEPDDLRNVIRQAADFYDLRQERKRLFTELQRANADLRTANALKSAFLDIASHELNTPVTFILGMSELAQERASQPDGAAFRRYIEVIRAGSLRLEHLVNNMLKLLQAGAFEAALDRGTAELRPFLERVSGQVAPYLEKRRQRLELRVEPTTATLAMDRGKMHDVVLNLVMNAIKFSPDGAILEINATAPPGQPVRIEVADQGLGISERDLPHIFAPFFSSFDTMHHSSGSFEYGKRGLGMGLPIAKKFVEMHGGTIAVESRQPRGTRFVIELPAST